MTNEVDRFGLNASEVARIDPFGKRKKSINPNQEILSDLEFIPKESNQEIHSAVNLIAIEKQKKILSDMIRNQIKDQKELWELIPELFLEREGRSGYSDKVYEICDSWVYQINGLFIDLKNGEIVSFDRYTDTKKQVSDDAVLTFLNSDDEFNALSIVEMNLKWARSPYPNYVKDIDKVEAKREEKRQLFGLSKPDFAKIENVIIDYKKRNGIV